MLGRAYKIVAIDEAHMIFDGGRGDLVNEILCLCRCLRISVLMLTGTLQRGEWRRLTMRLFYSAYVYPCIKSGASTASLGYAPPRRVEYRELAGSRKRKYPQLRVTYAETDWKILIFNFGTYALAHDDLEGAIVFAHTKAAVEELFIEFVHKVELDQRLCDQIMKRGDLDPLELPTDVFLACGLNELQRVAALGHSLRIAYNHSCCGEYYSEIVGDEVMRHQGDAYRVVFCTSTYAAEINLRNFNQVFINGNKERTPFGRVCRASEIAQMAGRGARWAPGIYLCHAFKFDQQFEESYEMPGINEKKPSTFKLSASSMPSIDRSYLMAAEVIARYVGRSILAMPLEFIDHVTNSLVCFNRAALCMERPVQRDNVLRAGARMFQVMTGEISTAEFSGRQEDTMRRISGVWLKSTNDIVALDCAALGFEHFEMIERLIIGSFCMTTPLRYVGSLLYFHGIGGSAGPIFERVAGGSANTLQDTQDDPAWTRILCPPTYIRRMMDAFKGDAIDKAFDTRRAHKLAQEDALQPAYEFCRGSASCQGAVSWRNNQTSALADHMKGIGCVTRALTLFSSALIADLRGSKAAFTAWDKQKEDIRALNQ
jgi:hypothetical protein